MQAGVNVSISMRENGHGSAQRKCLKEDNQCEGGLEAAGLTSAADDLPGEGGGDLWAFRLSSRSLCVETVYTVKAEGSLSCADCAGWIYLKAEADCSY